MFIVSLGKKLSILSYIYLPMIASAFQTAFYGLSLLPIADAIGLLLVHINMLIERGQKMVEKESQLTQMRTAVMLSQIQPHFLYNALTAIAGIEGNPPETVDAIASFAQYLRGDLDVLTHPEPISFAREMRHVDTYLELETIRFGDKIHIERDIQVTEFMLPPLTVQMLVENAVKHGITTRKNGGTVHISSYEKSEGFYVVVEDDGVGFDPNADLSRVHVGLRNCRARLEDFGGGTLTVISELGRGAKATVFIPRAGDTQDVQ